MADEDFSKEESEEELYVPLKLKRGVKTKKMVTVNLKDMEDEDFWKEDSEEQMSVPLKSKRRVKTKKMEYEGWGSKPLIEFLKEIGVETENKISQQDLTTIVNKYVAEKKLNNKVRKNRVNCDNWLRYLFGKKFVLRIKIHELLYSHLAENRDESEDEDSNNSEEDENKTAASRKRKVFCLNSKKLPETPTSCFASIIPENIKLLYLRRSLIEELLKDHDTFESKVVGSYVRIKCDPNDCSQKNSHQLLQVTGVRKAPECGDGGAEYFLEAAHFFKEILVSELSNENFKTEECDDLRHRIITGSFSRPTVMEFEQKAQILHKLITKQRISRELSLLQNQIEHANIKQWRRELYEYLQRKELLQKPAEQERLLLEVPNVIAEPLEPEAIVHEPAEDENTDMFCLPQSTIAGNLEDVPFNTEEDKSLSNDSLCGKDAAGVEISDKMSHRRRHKILMVSDFYYPNFGGVENHIYYLSQCLLNLGHKVVVMTHAYGNRSGVRYVTGGLKVYYVPWVPFLMQNTFPTLYGTLPIIRTILVRERISLVHGHQAFSTLCNEALMHARTMGYKVVFTDHSLYGFADVGSIHMNKVLQFTLADVSQAICVSHTSKENTVLRSGLPPEKVFVIPNAVDASMFKPAPKRIGSDEIIIVVISRLVYRKGADLLVEVIPGVCRLFPNVRFIVGGDGPKRVRLEEMREKHSLQDRVDMLGAVPHAKVQSVLISGHIFLNSSLTEAFCIAILEAASCGLLTVSTRVGGVPEVLPDDMIVLAEPDPDDMVQAIAKAIHKLPQINPQDMHRRMKSLYSWHDVAKRTEIVYDRALRCSDQNLLERLSRYLTCGSWAGKLFCLVMIIDYLLWHLLQLWKPDSHIEEVPDIMYGQQGEKPGDFV